MILFVRGGREIKCTDSFWKYKTQIPYYLWRLIVFEFNSWFESHYSIGGYVSNIFIFMLWFLKYIFVFCLMINLKRFQNKIKALHVSSSIKIITTLISLICFDITKMKNVRLSNHWRLSSLITHQWSFIAIITTCWYSWCVIMKLLFLFISSCSTSWCDLMMCETLSFCK